MKTLKGRLKLWNNECVGNVENKYKKIGEDLNKLDIKSEEVNLSEEEIIERKRLQKELSVVAMSKESLIRQKARSK